MSTAGRVLTGLGVLFAAVGLVIVANPRLAGMAAADQFYVSVVGAIALLQGGRYARDAWRSPVDGAEPGDPELVEGVPTPGDGFDESLAATFEVHSLKGRREVQDRLNRVGRAVLERRRDCSPDEAIEQLESGDWTDDALAAAFFSDEPRVPLVTRLRIRWIGKSSFGVRAERAATELERIWRTEL